MFVWLCESFYEGLLAFTMMNSFARNATDWLVGGGVGTLGFVANAQGLIPTCCCFLGTGTFHIYMSVLSDTK